MRNALGSIILILLSLAATQAWAWDWCTGSREIAKEFNLDGVDKVEVIAVSGELTIRGGDGSRVSAAGRACVQRGQEKRMDEIDIVSEREGATLRIIAVVPFMEDEDDGRIGGLDLTIDLPRHLPVSLTDSSGDLEVRGVASIELSDSSGDIDLEDIPGRVYVRRDSSGDIDMHNVGEVEIRADSSGGITIRRAASVQIDRDSSGDIDISDVQRDVKIGVDSSGDINVSDIGGGLSVRADSSGSIYRRNVAGPVDIPERKH